VNQANKTVWIDLGRADALNRQTSFSVYASDASDVKKAAKKGSVEVTQILGDHLAEARISNDVLNDPILPGDKIFTPIWSPGEQRHFAIAGFIDIDGDGQSDLRYVLDLIRMNGGVVDAYVDEAAKDKPVVGKITVNTRYLVQGAAPTETKADSLNVKRFSELVGAAERLGVQKIPVATLLEMMGSPAQPKVIHYGVGSTAKDYQITPPEGGQPVSGGSVNDLFKPRRPTTSGSAY